MVRVSYTAFRKFKSKIFILNFFSVLFLQPTIRLPINLQIFFFPILAPLTTNEFTIVNSHSFVDSLRDVADAENHYMSFFNVSNLFTNVPHDKTINICLDCLYTSSNDAIIGLLRNLFKQFLELSVKNSFFV